MKQDGEVRDLDDKLDEILKMKSVAYSYRWKADRTANDVR